MRLKKVNMKRFIYLFIFFLALTLGLFYVLNAMASRTLETSLINGSKNQMAYAAGILDEMIAEAGLYGIQYTADDSVRLYQSRIADLSAYDSQMAKNEIADRLTATILTSPSIDSIGIYWRREGTFISTSLNKQTKASFQKVAKRGWQTVDQSLYYFSVYPYIHPPKDPSDIQYVVGVQLKMDYLRSLLAKAVNGDSSNAFLLVNKSLLLSDKPVDADIVRKAEQTVAPDSQEIAKFDYHADGEDYYVLSKYIRPIDAYLITYTRMSDLMQPIRRNRQAFNVSILFILAAGVTVILLFYRNFYRSVRLLDKKFYQVEQGNYGTRISANPVSEFQNLYKSFNHMVAKIQQLFASLRVETELRRNAEVKQLQAQINPHFLYNSLFFIMSMADASPEAVKRMSKHLAEYYRYLTRLDSQEATLASELKLADHYLSIMSLCKNIEYEIRLPPELGERGIMPLIIQPIVENAIQHGIEERQGARRVAIDVKELDGGALILIADDGRGLTPRELRELELKVGGEKPPEGPRGIGLWNIHRRLVNAYGELSGLRFFANDWGGLSVMLYVDFSAMQGGTYEIAHRG